MNVTTLGECRVRSPLSGFVSDEERIPEFIRRRPGQPFDEGVLFELAGPRERLFFDPTKTRAGIVTCGGLCPGLNNVIRSLFLQLRYGYGVPEVLGFRMGYRGLDPHRGPEPFVLTHRMVDDIHQHGGTLLGTSRGPVDIGIAVEHLIRRGVDMLFCIGGDGTQRGAYALYEACRQRGHALSVVGVPKTIDNDVRYVTRTFGYLTALDESRRVIDAAHTEACSVQNGVALVKLMGRHAGFIAAGATVASQDVNFTLIPEVPFALGGPTGFLAALKRRVLERGHAVVVVAEGAGQDLFAESPEARDASGNVRLRDIGPFLSEGITTFFANERVPVTLRYFDPSYQIRSRPANCEDAVMCDQFARQAVHAALAGKTGLVVGFLHGAFIHVPTDLIVSGVKQVEPDGPLWQAVLATTGQPPRFE
ncbi:MAG: 6-phosphofructokinase [Acidobacteria bacterium]|nr:6-phosphofructokinase [Acidobacteriota bacterium]